MSEELRDELVAMMEQDQAERTGEAPGPWDDVARAERLHEVVDEHGWPTFDLVGEEGATAAWISPSSDPLPQRPAAAGHADRRPPEG